MEQKEGAIVTEIDLLAEALETLNAEAVHKVYIFAKTLSQISENPSNNKSGR